MNEGKREKENWKEILALKKGVIAVYNRKKEELMIRQDPHLITSIPKNLENKVFKWVLDKEIKMGREELFKWLLNREVKREMEARIYYEKRTI